MLLPNKESGAHWMNSNKNFFSPNKSPKVTFRSKSDFLKKCPGMSSDECDDYAREKCVREN